MQVWKKSLICLSLLLGVSLSYAQTTSPLPYDEQADAHAEIKHAIEQAKSHHKKVLLVFGANWCPDCRSLSAQMHEGGLAKKLKQRYVVVKVNVGNWDRNMDIAAEYGNPPKKGIPAIAVLSTNGQLLNATLAGELSVARSMSTEDVLKVFEKVSSQ
ncbi:thioredoxin family protein [Uliginosibacterium gangwonense]|uniref:thioredoxin family protein n=1 Tax=Uliginosibacterium gangwonense TaxID=392736 RepID=UPI00037D0EBE|nr:thioredoxin family protein [Uliginosibacterium gangwonense]